MIVLDDGAVRSRLVPADAVRAVRAALLAQVDGGLTAPARLAADLGDGNLIFTAGRLVGVGYGFRAYDTRPTSESDQVTIVYDDVSGIVRVVITGSRLGEEGDQPQ